MSYLYGDSTPSDLEGNYIEFLRDAVEFCVQVLLSDQRIVQAKAQTRALEHATVAEVERLQKLGPLVTKAFEGTSLGAAESPTARCAAAITNSANDLVRSEAIRMRDALDSEIAKREAAATQEREGCVKALETLVVKHDLPGAVSDVQLVLVAGGRYAGRARTRTGFGLEALVDLEVPSGNLFDRVVRVDRLMEKLDVQAPEVGGWLHKEVKRRPQHLEKLHITEFSSGAEGGLVRLRLGPDGTGAGFDILYANEAPRARMLRVNEASHTANGANGAAEQPFDVDEEDARKLLALHGKLAKAAAELAAHRRRLVDAKVDGEAMRTHAKPTLLPERLIAKMAPVVQEIAARSHSPGELILRRLLAGDRREEIFLSKAELKQKLESLNEANRGMFDPLWVSALPAASAKAAPVETAPAAGSAPHTQTGKYRAGTPAIGSVPLNASSAPAAATAATAAPVSGPPPAPPAAPKAALDAPAGDAMRRTLIGTAVPSAAQSAVPPADSVSKTPLAAATHVEALRKEAAGTIEAAVVKQADPASRS